MRLASVSIMKKHCYLMIFTTLASMRSCRSLQSRPAATNFLKAVPDHSNRGRSASQAKVHLVGKECVVCTSVVTTTRNPDGTANPGLFWNTQLFIRENEQWRCAEWQVMKISRGLKTHE